MTLASFSSTAWTSFAIAAAETLSRCVAVDTAGFSIIGELIRGNVRDAGT